MNKKTFLFPLVIVVSAICFSCNNNQSTTSEEHSQPSDKFTNGCEVIKFENLFKHPKNLKPVLYDYGTYVNSNACANVSRINRLTHYEAKDTNGFYFYEAANCVDYFYNESASQFTLYGDELPVFEQLTKGSQIRYNKDGTSKIYFDGDMSILSMINKTSDEDEPYRYDKIVKNTDYTSSEDYDLLKPTLVTEGTCPKDYAYSEYRAEKIEEFREQINETWNNTYTGVYSDSSFGKYYEIIGSQGVCILNLSDYVENSAKEVYYNTAGYNLMVTNDFSFQFGGFYESDEPNSLYFILNTPIFYGEIANPISGRGTHGGETIPVFDELSILIKFKYVNDEWFYDSQAKSAKCYVYNEELNPDGPTCVGSEYIYDKYSYDSYSYTGSRDLTDYSSYTPTGYHNQIQYHAMMDREEGEETPTFTLDDSFSPYAVNYDITSGTDLNYGLYDYTNIARQLGYITDNDTYLFKGYLDLGDTFDFPKSVRPINSLNAKDRVTKDCVVSINLVNNDEGTVEIPFDQLTNYTEHEGTYDVQAYKIDDKIYGYANLDATYGLAVFFKKDSDNKLNFVSGYIELASPNASDSK